MRRMTDSHRFAYAGARMQSRHGARPPEAVWAQLARIGEFDHLLQTVRASALAPWVADLTADSGPHRIERQLRERFRGEIAELAGWLPRRWRPAGAWLAWLPDLPAVAHLRRSGSPPGWMRADPVLAAIGGMPGTGSVRVRDVTRLLRQPDDGRTVAEHWLDGWRTRWPAPRGARHAALQRLERLSRRVLRPDDAAGGEALAGELRRAFRRHAREPAGAFAYALLVYLRFIRLRGALLRARLFPAAG